MTIQLGRSHARVAARSPGSETRALA
jgi:hypothetical protein